MADFPGNYLLSGKESKLSKDSVVIAPQITVIDKIRLLEHVSVLSESSMNEISLGIKLVLAL